MDDLISRQAAIDSLRMDVDMIPFNRAKAYVREAIEMVGNRLEQLPTIEPEIIRCRECKYAEVADKEDTQDGYTCQFHRGSIWFSGSYCSWAERRTDG